MKYKIDEKIHWIRPYVKLAEKLVDLSKLSFIETTLFDKSIANRSTFAKCTLNGKKFEIRIDRFYQTHIHKKGKRCKRILQEHSKIDILELLAHELAHIGHWEDDHSPKHKALESKLMIIFMKQLQKEGYVDTETERIFFKKEKQQCLAKR